MTTRLRDSERTRLIAYYIRTGKSPEGYEVTENDASKYKVRRIKSQLEVLQAKRDRLKKQLEIVEIELAKIESLEEESTTQQAAWELAKAKALDLVKEEEPSTTQQAAWEEAKEVKVEEEESSNEPEPIVDDDVFIEQ